ncbi:MAG TPA: hypothetical protein V6D29_16000 [Leptolyngbyaceae cyanobacterium]
MNLWLVCFFLLFLGAEGLQWIGQVSGLSEVDLSWPIIVLGGVGLAIASNYRLPNQTTPLKVQDSDLPTFPTVSTQPLPTSTQPPIQVIDRAKAKPSISFEIPKPRS